jgi:hypothetical protein
MPASQPARARFAPSPTGRMHLGSARTALYDFLLPARLVGSLSCAWKILTASASSLAQRKN